MDKKVALTRANSAFKAGRKSIAARILIQNYGHRMAKKLLQRFNQKEEIGASASNFPVIGNAPHEDFPWRTWRGPVRVGTSPAKFRTSQIPSWAKFLEPKLWTPTHVIALLGASALLFSYLFRKDR